MKIKNQQHYLALKNEYEKYERGAKVFAFAYEWANMMEQEYASLCGDQETYSIASIGEAKSISLVKYQKRRVLPMDYVQEALVLLNQIWDYGDDLIESLSPMEEIMFMTQLSNMIGAKQEAAKKEAQEAAAAGRIVGA
ncbi:hypothetical protein [Streptomyces sp. CoH17]|uniref:hypothetical protein n=1 Tax=Streptomyces sp. CoH17 TaxID=2992806 RepID=UPI002271A3AD|nr:hypothetical protein [Streptomyces sp. CoH17]